MTKWQQGPVRRASHSTIASELLNTAMSDYDVLADDLREALDADDQTRVRGIVRDELGEPLTGDLEQFILMEAMGLPSDGVLDRIKAKCGDDIGALLCMAMVRDLQISGEKAKAKR